MLPLNSFRRACLALAINQALFLPTQAATLLVNSALDDGDGANCTLREAIVSINAGTDQGNGCGGTDFGSGDTINFSDSLSGQTISLNGTHLSIGPDVDVSINGLGQEELAVSANGDPNHQGVFKVTSATVRFAGLTITQGYADVGAGGISAYEESNINLSNCTVSNNSGYFGGGIRARSSNITLTGSTLSGNSALYGGGIFASSSIIDLSNSTVSGNTGVVIGGGLHGQRSTLILNNSTVSNNTVTLFSGGGGLV